MTTLEWLLVLAAVAGLAALGVVVVQSVVGDTAEDVASHSARQEAADLAVSVLAERWRDETPLTQGEADEINRTYRRRCLALGVLYADIDLDVVAKDGRFGRGPGWAVGPPACEIR